MGDDSGQGAKANLDVSYPNSLPCATVSGRSLGTNKYPFCNSSQVHPCIPAPRRCRCQAMRICPLLVAVAAKACERGLGGVLLLLHLNAKPARRKSWLLILAGDLVALHLTSCDTVATTRRSQRERSEVYSCHPRHLTHLISAPVVHHLAWYHFLLLLSVERESCPTIRPPLVTSGAQAKQSKQV